MRTVIITIDELVKMPDGYIPFYKKQEITDCYPLDEYNYYVEVITKLRTYKVFIVHKIRRIKV